MRRSRLVLGLLVVGALAVPAGRTALAAADGPLLDLAEALVLPGDSLRVTVLGVPGHPFARAMSRADSALSVGAVALDLGPDAVVVGSGTLDARGQAVVRLVFPEGEDRLHLQAVTAPSAAFAELTASPPKVVRDARLVARAAASRAAGAGESQPLADAPVTAARLASAWRLDGNAGTNPATQFLGTTDAQPLEFRVAGQRVLRLELPPGGSPNILGGHPVNTIAPGVSGATLAGGGAASGLCGNTFGVDVPCPNSVTGSFGTVGGGSNNQAGGTWGTVGGGLRNRVSGLNATVAGGSHNTAGGFGATVAGGTNNSAINDPELFADGGHPTVGGGESNSATGEFASVPGGFGGAAGLWGQLAYAAGRFGNVTGTAQWAVYTLRRQTTTDVEHTLFLDGVSRKLTIAAGRAMAFDGLLIGRRGDGIVAGYQIRGVIHNVAGATTFVGVPAVTVLGDSGSDWTVVLQAHDSTNSLDILVTGEAGQTIRWVAVVRTVEVAF